MGKIRRLRQKYHASLSKDGKDQESNGLASAPRIPQLVPVVKKTTTDGVGSSGNMFAGLQIKLGEAESTPPTGSMDVSDTMSTISSGRRDRSGSKKERRKQRHEEFMQKIDVVRASSRAEKERKKREKTAVVGDMHPLLNALPSLEELFASSNKNKDSQIIKEVKGTKKQKEAQKDFMSDMQTFMTIQQDPIYRNDPFGAVCKGVENRVLNEQEDS
ncbi:protein FAM207A-like [Homarus americanus]|uniref:protein FAM207A-like n=1 Tax=Homarus americanus TaxID=6706 RepID=UPI001C45F763|nr:protein FAM207A-like [Homarus americanus]